MNTTKIDWLNTLLIIISFITAFHFPFELFILIYALLGPLHYLTEINWIKEKNYFTESKPWAVAMLVFSVIVTLPFIFSLFDLKGKAHDVLKLGITHSITLLPIAFLLAFLALSSFTKKTKFYLFLIGTVIILLVSLLPAYQVWIGIFLPTVIHVYFFTLLFMWYGVLKSKSAVGKLNIFLLIGLPLFLIIMKIDGTLYNSQNVFRTVFIDNKFFTLNATISKVLGLTDGKHFSFFEVVFIKIQIFIAFAYTYHYLNWFSKTTIIGWHKNITQKRSIIILCVWLAAVALYFYNYKAGVAFVLFLSMLHVFMEFPLNIITMKAIFNSFGTKNTLPIKK